MASFTRFQGSRHVFGACFVGSKRISWILEIAIVNLCKLLDVVNITFYFPCYFILGKGTGEIFPATSPDEEGINHICHAENNELVSNNTSERGEKKGRDCSTMDEPIFLFV